MIHREQSLFSTGHVFTILSKFNNLHQAREFFQPRRAKGQKLDRKILQDFLHKNRSLVVRGNTALTLTKYASAWNARGGVTVSYPTLYNYMRCGYVKLPV